MVAREEHFRVDVEGRPSYRAVGGILLRFPSPPPPPPWFPDDTPNGRLFLSLLAYLHQQQESYRKAVKKMAKEREGLKSAAQEAGERADSATWVE